MKKKGVKTKMKKKLLLFIGVLTLTLSVLLAVPRTKAQTNTRLVVQSYNVDAGTITFYDYDTQMFFGTFNFNNVYDARHFTALITKKEFIPYIFRLGDVYELIDYDPPYIAVLFVRPADSRIFYTLSDMVDQQVYEYKGIVENMYIFQQGINLYRVPMQGINFKNEISSQIEFSTILKPGNFYSWQASMNSFYLSVKTPDYIYQLGYITGQDESSNNASRAYQDGYEAGIKTAEGLLESEYQRGLQNGFADGYDVGLNKGYQNGFDDAYNEIISDDEYTLGYNNGFKDGEKSKIAKNNEAFYGSIQKWLVPAIIVVIVLGGIMSISALKSREQ